MMMEAVGNPENQSDTELHGEISKKDVISR
jgi:hypothetical protein